MDFSEKGETVDLQNPVAAKLDKGT